jgi:hypothetical protein
MKKIFLVATLFVALCTSCKKEKCDTPVAPVDLSGTIFKGTTGGLVSGNISFTFNADGTMLIQQATTNFTGTWNKSPNSNVVNFQFENGTAKFKGSGTLNAEVNKIAGTFFAVSSPSIVFTFSVDKQ